MKHLVLFALINTFIACQTTENSEGVKSMISDLTNFDALWNYHAPEETRKKFLDVYEQHKNSDDTNYLLELKTQIARTYSLQAKFEEAHKILDEVEAKLSADTAKAKVRYQLERGRTFNSANQKQEARSLFEQAFENANTIAAENLAIDAAHMVAIAATSIEDKIVWNQNGLNTAKKSQDKNSKRWIGTFLNNMGWDLFDAGRYGEALTSFKECWSFHEQSNNENELKIAKWSVAKTLRLMGQINESLDIQLDLLKADNGIDDSGYGYEELAELYLVKNEVELSKEYFKKAYDILSKDIWLQKNEKERLDRIRGLML